MSHFLIPVHQSERIGALWDESIKLITWWRRVHRTRKCVVLAAFLTVASCDAAVSTRPSDYIGEYVFAPYGASPSSTFADLLILRSDSVAIEVRYSPGTGAVSTAEKHRHISSHGDNATIVIGGFEHPIEHGPPRVRLGIDDDLNTYYEKVR